MDNHQLTEFVNANPIEGLSRESYLSILKDLRGGGDLNEQEFSFLLGNFFYYLNNVGPEDFVVDFDQLVEWCGYSRKDHAKQQLIKNLKENVDYNVTYPNAVSGSTPEYSGDALDRNVNKEKIMLTVNGFKRFCMKSNAKKSDEVIDYFVKIEGRYFSTLKKSYLENAEKEKRMIKEREDDLLFAHRKDSLVYLGLVEPDIVKFGFSDGNVYERVVYCHKNKFNSFDLKYVIPSEDYVELERKIKTDLKDRIVTKEYNGVTHTELVKLDCSFGITELYKKVIQFDREIKEASNNENSAAFKMLYDENRALKKENLNYKRGWQLLKKDLEKNEYDYEPYETYFEKNVDPRTKRKYFLEFLENLYSDNENETVFFSNSEIYEDYCVFLSNFSESYTYTQRTFGSELFKFSPDIVKKSKKKNKGGERVFGKKIKFVDKFIHELCVMKKRNLE